MTLIMRNYQSEEDYWRIRAFLREVFLLNNRRQHSWPVTRLDYWRWHLIPNCNTEDSVESATFIWETAEGKIAAVVNTEEHGIVAYLHVHPDFRSVELEEEMLAFAEQRFGNFDAQGRRILIVSPDQHDTFRKEILTRRGYTRGKGLEYQYWGTLDKPIPDAPIPSGYTVRALGDVAELPARSWASWRAFHPDEPDSAYEGWEWYHNIQRMPLYRRDLDIVVAAPTGEVASFVTMWYDDTTRTGHFDPMGTMPEHQRRGLCKAAVCEALRRLQRMGATLAIGVVYEPGPIAVMASVLSDHTLAESWIKVLAEAEK